MCLLTNVRTPTEAKLKSEDIGDLLLATNVTSKFPQGESSALPVF